MTHALHQRRSRLALWSGLLCAGSLLGGCPPLLTTDPPDDGALDTDTDETDAVTDHLVGDPEVGTLRAVLAGRDTIDCPTVHVFTAPGGFWLSTDESCAVEDMLGQGLTVQLGGLDVSSTELPVTIAAVPPTTPRPRSRFSYFELAPDHDRIDFDTDPDPIDDPHRGDGQLTLVSRAGGVLHGRFEFRAIVPGHPDGPTLTCPEGDFRVTLP